LIGADDDDFFKGRIDEVRIYNRALDEQELQPDLIPPSTPVDVDAMTEEEEEESTYVTWRDSSDPAYPDGHPGSGVSDYLYRYRLEAGSWSPWQSTLGAGFGIEGTANNEHIDLRLAARDNAGNISPIRAAAVTTTSPVLTPENIGARDPNESGDATIYSEPKHPNSEEEGSGFGGGLLLESGLTEELCAEGPNPCGKYDWKAAGRYLAKWTFPGRNNNYVDEHHNHEFQYFGGSGGDCTNFVSQALWAGNLRFMRAHGRNSPDMDANGEANETDYDYGEGSWWSAYHYDLLHKYLGKIFDTPTESWDNAAKLFNHLIEYELGYVYTGSPVRQGDIIFYDLHHGKDQEEIDHTQIVYRVTHKHIYVAQHSQAYVHTLNEIREHVKKKYGVRGEDWEWWFVKPIHSKANIP
jgi:hypothetical protein